MNGSMNFYRQLLKTDLPKSVAVNMTKSIYPNFTPPKNKCKTTLKPTRTISKKKSSCGCEQNSQIKFYLSTYIQTHSNFSKKWLHNHLHLLSSSQVQRFQMALRNSRQIDSLIMNFGKM